MKLIKLTKGYQTLVDDEDYAPLTAWSWHYRNGYACRCKNRNKECIFMHRQLHPVPPGYEIDHINGDKLDNRKANLRHATRSQNGANKAPQKNNKLGVKGVMFNRDLQKYQATITFNRRAIYLGLYETVEEASNAYYDAAKRYFGEFARQ